MIEESRLSNRRDSLTLKTVVVDLTHGRYRGAVSVTEWKDGAVSTRIRHCTFIRTESQAAETDAQALATVLNRANADLTT
jgi:hypothetical protein